MQGVAGSQQLLGSYIASEPGRRLYVQGCWGALVLDNPCLQHAFWQCKVHAGLGPAATCCTCIRCIANCMSGVEGGVQCCCWEATSHQSQVCIGRAGLTGDVCATMVVRLLACMLIVAVCCLVVLHFWHSVWDRIRNLAPSTRSH
jgi:hypothetical protein